MPRSALTILLRRAGLDAASAHRAHRLAPAPFPGGESRDRAGARAPDRRSRRGTSRARAVRRARRPDRLRSARLPRRAEHLPDRRDLALPDLRCATTSASPFRRISSTISSADFSRAPGMSSPPAGIVGDAERRAQHVVDDVVVRVVELELAASPWRGHGSAGPDAAVRARARTRVVVVEPRGEVRIGDQPAGREHAHGRHALVERRRARRPPGRPDAAAAR